MTYKNNTNMYTNDPPTPQKMNRRDTTSEVIAIPIVTATELSPFQEPVQKGRRPNGHGRDDVYIEELTMDTIEQMRIIHNEGFSEKLCCLCCPVADTDGRIQRFYSKNPKRLPMCGVAFGIEDDKSDDYNCNSVTRKRTPIPLGYIQLATYPTKDKDGLHTTKPGETYIEQVSVASAARGKGVGKLLLQWAEARARDQRSTVLTLSVLNGNAARRLYERFGFKAVQSKSEIDAACDECIRGCVVCCVLGRPYGMFDPHFGAVDMKMQLLDDERSSSDDESIGGASIFTGESENNNFDDDDDDDNAVTGGDDDNDDE